MTTKYLPIRAVANRYGVSDRTIDRWIRVGDLPRPVFIQSRRYWLQEALDEHDKVRAVANAQPPGWLQQFDQHFGSKTGAA
jgi:predicted DNA-binding transcriptional regulator AlpA